MRSRQIFIGLMTMLSVLLATGCKSRDYYVEKQVEAARTFALENDRTLTPLECEYIRFNKPEVMYESYIGEKKFFSTSFTGGTEFAQMCIVWNLPDNDVPVIVFGISTHGVRGWDPLRIIRRKFRTMDFNRENAIGKAVLYAMNNMLYLSDHMRNRVRFSPPTAITSTFPLDLEHRDIELQAGVKDLPTQISFIWQGEKKGENVVVSGLCGKNYAKWTAVTGLVRNNQDIHDHTITEIYQP